MMMMMMQRSIATKLSTTLRRASAVPQCHAFAYTKNATVGVRRMSVAVEQTKGTKDPKGDDKVLKAACGDVTDNDDDDEMEEMFVNADASFAHTEREWGGPRRGGRLPEPTRFGDWERKGRCTDF